MHQLLAEAATTTFSYSRPFLQPLPVWDYWPLLAIPLCIGIAVVYKSIKCAKMKQVPKESLILTGWILLTFVCAAIALSGFVKLMER